MPHDPAGRHLDDGCSSDLANVSLERLPWSSWTKRDEYLDSPTGLARRNQRQEFENLTRLPKSDPVSHFTATVDMQMLRAFPQMMLQRETFPPFIHGQWYMPSNAQALPLPEPLVNCIGISQVFASQNPESKPFLWRAVKGEQRSFIEKGWSPSSLSSVTPYCQQRACLSCERSSAS